MGATEHNFAVPADITPGTAVEAGERFNLPRPETTSVVIYPTGATAGQLIEISEVRRAERSAAQYGALAFTME